MMEDNLTEFLGPDVVGYMRDVFAILLIGLMARVCWTDIRSLTIANREVLAVVALAVLVQAGWGADWSITLLLALAVFATCYGLFRAGVMGGGDVKLIGALMLWFGYPHGVSFLIATMIAGGVIAVVLLLVWAQLRMLLLRAADRLPEYWHEAVTGTGSLPVPYGVAIAAGAVMTEISAVGWAEHPLWTGIRALG